MTQITSIQFAKRTEAERTDTELTECPVCKSENVEVNPISGILTGPPMFFRTTCGDCGRTVDWSIAMKPQ